LNRPTTRSHPVPQANLGLTSRFTGGPPKQEPLNQLVPLIEFAVDNAPGRKSVATMNPGLSYAAVTWQLAVEAVVPLNNVSDTCWRQNTIATLP